ncbi:Chaperone protein EcpD precursor [Phytobacter ursingii]|nr:Chaperone protein EcpD precursor [Phytobacter ursingii]
MKTWRCFFYMLLLVLNPALAGIQINATRVIYPAAKKEVTLSITNESTTPRLLQAWVDNGDPDVQPETAKLPFLVTPPISRIDPGKGQTLRIIFTGGTLPADRESVFWLNILEVQPKSSISKENSDRIKFTVRSRLKVFYRPMGLPGSPNDAAAQLHWRLISQGKGYALECDNPTAWNVSFHDVRLKSAPAVADTKQNGMCPAKGKKLIPVKEVMAPRSGRVLFTTIDDYGGYKEGESGYGP